MPKPGEISEIFRSPEKLAPRMFDFWLDLEKKEKKKDVLTAIKNGFKEIETNPQHLVECFHIARKDLNRPLNERNVHAAEETIGLILDKLPEEDLKKVIRKLSPEEIKLWEDSSSSLSRTMLKVVDEIDPEKLSHHLKNRGFAIAAFLKNPGIYSRLPKSIQKEVPTSRIIEKLKEMPEEEVIEQAKSRKDPKLISAILSIKPDLFDRLPEGIKNKLTLPEKLELSAEGGKLDERSLKDLVTIALKKEALETIVGKESWNHLINFYEQIHPKWSKWAVYRDNRLEAVRNILEIVCERGLKEDAGKILKKSLLNRLWMSSPDPPVKTKDFNRAIFVHLLETAGDTLSPDEITQVVFNWTSRLYLPYDRKRQDMGVKGGRKENDYHIQAFFNLKNLDELLPKLIDGMKKFKPVDLKNALSTLSKNIPVPLEPGFIKLLPKEYFDKYGEYLLPMYSSLNNAQKGKVVEATKKKRFHEFEKLSSENQLDVIQNYLHDYAGQFVKWYHTADRRNIRKNMFYYKVLENMSENEFLDFYAKFRAHREELGGSALFNDPLYEDSRFLGIKLRDLQIKDFQEYLRNNLLESHMYWKNRIPYFKKIFHYLFESGSADAGQKLKWLVNQMPKRWFPDLFEDMFKAVGTEAEPVLFKIYDRAEDFGLDKTKILEELSKHPTEGIARFLIKIAKSDLGRLADVSIDHLMTGISSKDERLVKKSIPLLKTFSESRSGKFRQEQVNELFNLTLHSDNAKLKEASKEALISIMDKNTSLAPPSPEKLKYIDNYLVGLLKEGKDNEKAFGAKMLHRLGLADPATVIVNLGEAFSEENKESFVPILKSAVQDLGESEYKNIGQATSVLLEVLKKDEHTGKELLDDLFDKLKEKKSDARFRLAETVFGAIKGNIEDPKKTISTLDQMEELLERSEGNPRIIEGIGEAAKRTIWSSNKEVVDRTFRLLEDLAKVHNKDEHIVRMVNDIATDRVRDITGRELSELVGKLENAPQGVVPPTTVSMLKKLAKEEKVPYKTVAEILLKSGLHREVEGTEAYRNWNRATNLWRSAHTDEGKKQMILNALKGEKPVSEFMEFRGTPGLGMSIDESKDSSGNVTGVFVNSDTLGQWYIPVRKTKNRVEVLLEKSKEPEKILPFYLAVLDWYGKAGTVGFVQKPREKTDYGLESPETLPKEKGEKEEPRKRKREPIV